MASPSVTYTFVNSTTADANQVNQNFADLIAGMTDGSKDFNINALTCTGKITANGNVDLGNAAGDTITVNGVFAGTGGDASATQKGLITTTDQAFAGKKTFSGGYVGNTPFFYRFATLSNPSTETAFSAGTEVLSLSGISQSHGSGTLTITFANTGYYQVILSGSASCQVGQSTISIRMTPGGTATRYYSKSAAGGNLALIGHYTESNIADNQDASFLFHVYVSSANQTLTINPAGYMNNPNAANSMYMGVSIVQI